MESALHDALDKAEKQALKHKEKIIGRKRNAKVGKEDIYPEYIAI
jgi:ribosome-associated translation inhibitor RaiA